MRDNSISLWCYSIYVKLVNNSSVSPTKLKPYSKVNISIRWYSLASLYKKPEISRDPQRLILHTSYMHSASHYRYTRHLHYWSHKNSSLDWFIASLLSIIYAQLELQSDHFWRSIYTTYKSPSIYHRWFVSFFYSSPTIWYLYTIS